MIVPRWLGLIVVVAVAAPAGIPTAAIGQVDPCGEALEGLTTQVPRAARAGGVVALAVEHDGFSPIANAAVAFGDQLVPFTPRDGRRVRVLVRAPEEVGRLGLSVTWEQPEEGLTCAGRDDYTVQVLDQDAKIGDTLAARVDGRWLMRFTPINFRGRPESVRWRIRSLCDAGACGFTVRSRSGGRYRYKLGDDGALRARGRVTEPIADCTIVQKVLGQVVSRRVVADAFTERWRIVLEVGRERDDNGPIEALTVTGTVYHRLVVTPAARAAGCTGGQILRERIRGRRL